MATKNTKNEAKILTLFITGHEVKTHDDKTFTAYKTQIGKLNMDVRFRKESELYEAWDGKDGYIKLPVDKININTSGKYPVLWVE